ncbi:basic leucine zipper 34-like [Argentina anserina]|uniref:basic leucine zipper 34-like n=1 Tax=Argentina anserina TaxID=57926 RepID=UPI0021767A64|nr:basic leucine zipper 34-like [Potentilla anserina]
MAQLPPKVPTMTSNWPDFSHHQKMSTCFAPPNGNAASQNNNPCWVDEFLDFSSARRGSHRRSVSDSITFLEAPMQDECRVSAGALQPEPPTHNSHTRNVHEFDRFDDEQFMSMFTTDEIAAAAAAGSCSNPSTPSDHNSINDEDQQQGDDGGQKKKKRDNKVMKHESEEAESECQLEAQQTLNGDNNNASNNTSGERKIDPKRVKRILANRQSAQRSRVRKLQYISELERSVTSLQAEVSVLSPRVAFLDHQRLLLNVDNSALKQRIAALAQDKIFKDAHQEALKREIERLRQVYHQQNLKKMDNNNTNNNIEQSPNSDAITAQHPDNAAAAAADQKEQLLNVSS